RLRRPAGHGTAGFPCSLQPCTGWLHQPRTGRSRGQPFGSALLQFARLFTKTHGRVLAPGLTLLDTLVPDDVAQRSPLASAWRQLDLALNNLIDRQLRAA